MLLTLKWLPLAVSALSAKAHFFNYRFQKYHYKKVLPREFNKHNTRHVASTRCSVYWRGTYPAWRVAILARGIPTLDGGYLPQPRVPMLGRWEPTLDGGAYLGWGYIHMKGDTYSGWGVTYLGWGVLTSARGTYAGQVGTYLGWWCLPWLGVHTYEWGYLPWMGGYLPWTGVLTQGRGSYHQAPIWLEGKYPLPPVGR